MLEIEEFNGIVSTFQTMVNNFLTENRFNQREFKEKVSLKVFKIKIVKFFMLKRRTTKKTKELDLNEKLETNKKEIIQLDDEIKEETNTFKKIKTDYESRLAMLDALITENTTRNASAMEEIRDMTPGYELLCAHLAEIEKDFDQVKLKYISKINYSINMDLYAAKTSYIMF